MPYEFDIDPVTGFALETWTGRLTVQEVMACIAERHADPRYAESMPRLIDLTGAHGNPTEPEIRKLALIHKSSRYRGPCALVAPEDIQFGLGRMFGSIAGSDRSVGIFRSRERALEWLDRCLAEARP